MGYCLWIAVTATSILNVAMHIRGHPSQQMMQQQLPTLQQQSPLIAVEPSQNQCQQLKSLKHNPNSNVNQIQNWSVIKVTKMSDMAAGENSQDDSQLQRSFCNVFSNVDNCVGVSYTVTSRGNNGFSAQTFAYDGKTQNLEPQERSFNLVDQNFEIYSVKGNNAQQNVVTGVSQGATPQETLFAAIAENSSGAWKMFALCDGSMAWIVAPADELRNNPQYFNSYKAEIEGALQQIKASMASMSQGTGAMNTNISAAPTTVNNPLPVVNIFGGSSSSMTSLPTATSSPTATSPPQASGVQNAYGHGQQFGNDVSPPQQTPFSYGQPSGNNVSPPPPSPPPGNAFAYASVGTPPSPMPSPLPPPPPPPPAMLFGSTSPPVSQPSGVVIP